MDEHTGDERIGDKGGKAREAREELADFPFIPPKPILPDHETAMIQTWQGVHQLDQKIDALENQLAAQARQLEAIQATLRNIAGGLQLHGRSVATMVGGLLTHFGIDPVTLEEDHSHF